MKQFHTMRKHLRYQQEVWALMQVLHTLIICRYLWFSNALLYYLFPLSSLECHFLINNKLYWKKTKLISSMRVWFCMQLEGATASSWASMISACGCACELLWPECVSHLHMCCTLFWFSSYMSWNDLGHAGKTDLNEEILELPLLLTVKLHCMVDHNFPSNMILNMGNIAWLIINSLQIWYLIWGTKSQLLWALEIISN